MLLVFMKKLTAQNLCSFIGQLSKRQTYQYLNPRNHGQIKIVDIEGPEGPIRIQRCNPSKLEVFGKEKKPTISSQLLWRVANAIQENIPFNIDRILGASYNTRAVLETLLAHTPQFYYCYPGRIESINSSSKIKPGHKHLLWLPDLPHQSGVVNEYPSSVVISEIPSQEIIYESLTLPKSESEDKIDVDIQRRHAQIQILLVKIGCQLNYRTWVAQNDKGILYQGIKLGEHAGVVSSLRDERILSSYENAIKAGLLIDCIWFESDRFMPAVIEIEHSTGVTSGLSRMRNFQDKIPPYETRYVIVAPDEDRGKVIKEATKPQFESLKIKYFSYSAVEELYSLCQRRKLMGVSAKFLDCFMEDVLS